MAAHIVKCLYCGQSFDANEIEYVKINRRYAHKDCYEKADSKIAEEERQKDALYKYIQELFEGKSNFVIVKKTIDKIMESNPEYTYLGIYRALKYFYEIKKNDISKSNYNVGIVPYVYQEAYEYFRIIDLARISNKNQMNYKNEEIEIHIKNPDRQKMKKRNLFSFLDKEGE